MGRLSSRRGQSIIELLVGIVVGVIFLIGTATAIAPALQGTKQTGLEQSQAALASDLEASIQAWAPTNWSTVLSLATGTGNPYYMATSFNLGTSTLAFVQVASNTSEFDANSDPSYAAQFNASVVSGDTIVIFINTGSTSENISGCYDTNNPASSYKEAVTVSNIIHGQTSDIWYATNVTGGVDPTVTCDVITSSGYDMMAAMDYSGAATLDATSGYSSQAATSTFFTTGTSTTNAAHELIVGAFEGAAVGSETFTPEAGFTSPANLGPGYGIMVENEQQTSPGPISATALSNVSDAQDNVMATFEEAQTVGQLTNPTYATGTQAISLEGIAYNRSFYLSNVYRDSNGNVTSTVSGNNYDPSTRLVTLVSVASTTPHPATTTLSFYITRNVNNAYGQTSWLGGGGVSTPLTVSSSTYAAATNTSVSVTGAIQLAGGGGSCTF